MSCSSDIGFVYVVSKGGVSKVGSSINGEMRSAKVADNLFGDSAGCLIAVRRCSHYKEVEKFVHNALSESLLASSPIYPKETFSVCFDVALGAIDEGIEFLVKNPPKPVDVTALTGSCLNVRNSSVDYDEILKAEDLCKMAGIGCLFDELRKSDDLNEVTACMAKTIATLLISNSELSAGISSLCKQIREASGEKVVMQ